MVQYVLEFFRVVTPLVVQYLVWWLRVVAVMVVGVVVAILVVQ